MTYPRYDILDEALDRLSGFGPDLVNGNFNHAPMVAEALCALGRSDAVMPWIERYTPRLKPRPAAAEPIAPEGPAANSPDAWHDALGRRERFADWSQFFAAALREAAWRVVLDFWAARLAPGIAAAATHGAIRTGHAVRALSAGETPPRLRELADALASWAAGYQELPAADGRGNPALPPHEALLRVAVVPPEQRKPGNITSALTRLADFPEFAPAIGLADLSKGAAVLPTLAELFSRVLLVNANSPLTAIVFIHGVTSLAALGHIALQVREATARALLRYGWQAACGLYACFGGAGFAEAVVDAGIDPEALIDRALAHGDEHVIKFTEAAVQFHARLPSPAFPAAAARVGSLIARR